MKTFPTNHLTFLNARDVATTFFQGKIPYQTVLRMTRDGQLPAFKQGKRYIYLLSALENWVGISPND